jgi:hypothetical protein
MKKIKNILFSILGIIAGLLFVFLANDIYQENERVQKIKGVDAKVIAQLQKIRIAQKAYLSVKNKYCNSWDSLNTFILHEEFVIEQIKETIEQVGGKEKIVIQRDTLSSVSVYDSLQNSLGYANTAGVSQLWRVPVSDTIFTIRADKMANGQKICEVRDPAPLNPKRQKKGDLKPLQIGSLEISTLSGNWE